MKTLEERENFMADKLLIRCNPELKSLIEQAALEEGLSGGMGELASRILAAYFKRPDLARMHRQKRGPKVKLNGRKQPA